jgi:hypothetical protein
MLATSAPTRAHPSRAILWLALAPAAFLFLRTSPWLVVPDLIAVVILFALGSSTRSATHPLDLSFGEGGRRLGDIAGSLWHAPAFLARTAGAAIEPPSATGRRQLAAAGRGLLLAIPLMLLLSVLLASADGVFASFFAIDPDLGRLPTYLIVGLCSASVAAAFLRQSLDPAPRPERAAAFRLEAIEACVVLSGLVAVYALFACSQVVAATRGSDYVLRTTGLTYAEYARSGFFQLLWAAGLTLVVLLGIRSMVSPASVRAHRVVTGLSLAAVALTLAVVRAAIIRLDLYADTFGLTMLRLYSTGFAWWVGLVFVLTGLSLAGLCARRRWLPAVVLGTALVGVIALNVANPERLVVEHNVRHAERTGRFDLDYLTSLSDDAIPTIVDALPRLPEPYTTEARRTLCRDHESEDPIPLNLSARRADQALDELCR